MCDAVVNYEDMSEEGQRIVDASNEPPAGTFPTGLSREELAAWMKERFASPPPTDRLSRAGETTDVRFAPGEPHDMVMVRRDDLTIVEKYIDHDLMVEKGDMLADQAFERILAIVHAPPQEPEGRLICQKCGRRVHALAQGICPDCFHAAAPPTVTPEDVLHALDTAHENPSMEVNADTVEQELHDFLFPPSKPVAAPREEPSE